MAVKHFDLIVLGAGSGGIAAAQKAASYGARVAVIEMGRSGGTCVNLGCVPKKIMWYAGSMADSFQYGADYGFQYDAPDFNSSKLVNNRNHYIDNLSVASKEKLIKKHITYLQGIGSFVDAKTITVNGKNYSADHIIIATGSHPVKPEIKGAAYGIDSDGFFALKKLPEKIAIIGGGYIAVELGSILNRLGSKVTILLRKNKPLRQFDSTLSDSLMEIMTAQGIKWLPNHEPTEIMQQRGRLIIQCNRRKTPVFDTVLFATGRRARIEHLNLCNAGIKLDAKGNIVADKGEATNIPHIYAIGDVTGKKMLTPVAIAAGRKLAARIFNREKNSYLDYANIPTVIFTHPPVGSVGLSEQAAVEKYGRNRLTIYHAQFNSLFYALSKTKIPSSIKLITLKKSEKVIGCHLIDPNADEILQGFAVAIKMGATKKDFDNVVAIHPTSAEELVTLKK